MAVAVDAGAAEVVAAFRQAGIEAVLLRGPAIAETLYDDRFERSYSDVDLLVKVSDFPLARRLLVALDYREAPVERAFPEGRPRHAETWFRGDGRAVDLHRSLVGVTAGPERVWHLFRDDARPLSVGGVDALIPSPAVTAVIVVLHAAHHGARGGHPRRDLRLARAKLSADVWQRAEQIAGDLGAAHAFQAGLGGRAVAGRATEDVRGGRAFHVAQGLVWLRAARGARAKSRLLRELLFPSPVTMRQRSELAARGSVGLALAYATRLMDGARHIPHALRALAETRPADDARP
jgi:hypothetical protein